MASSKDTFEAKSYAANSFACGAFRGIGVVAVSLCPIIDDFPDFGYTQLSAKDFGYTQTSLIDFDYLKTDTIDFAE